MDDRLIRGVQREDVAQEPPAAPRQVGFRPVSPAKKESTDQEKASTSSKPTTEPKQSDVFPALSGKGASGGRVGVQ